ncbi:hypothetical protein T05_7971 [Trichinella murrelli]|uniref:Uncharacterized protein n=1 Tax=Trichinella murrelli TaxID=144512 RepID=A0A0V0UHB6_9BILA|nr:hypothetical protein T05_7971 [Trichinella murrelli]
MKENRVAQNNEILNNSAVTQFAWLYGHGKKALSERRTNNKAMPNYVALLEKELCLKDRGCHQSAVFH